MMHHTAPLSVFQEVRVALRLCDNSSVSFLAEWYILLALVTIFDHILCGIAQFALATLSVFDI